MRTNFVGAMLMVAGAAIVAVSVFQLLTLSEDDELLVLVVVPAPGASTTTDE